ncbi:MAG: FxsA family protein [Thermoleophilaceae bacterium]|nr:FxsA family protein [Thermoleophilaceae bacterium]
MPLALLVTIFIVVPIAELYVILEVVGKWLGAPLTIALLVLDSILGSLLLRSQGRVVWKRFNEAMAAGKVPHREVVDGVLVIFGGAFLITPGFITDIIGLLLLIPPTRALVRKVALRRLGARIVVSAVSRGVRDRGAAPGRDYDVEGTAREAPRGDLPPA